MLVPSNLVHNMSKLIWVFVSVKDSTKRKVEQDANGKRGQEDRSREGRGNNAFDMINKGMMEPKVNSSQLTPLNRSCEEILCQHKDQFLLAH